MMKVKRSDFEKKLQQKQLTFFAKRFSAKMRCFFFIRSKNIFDLQTDVAAGEEDFGKDVVFVLSVQKKLSHSNVLDPQLFSKIVDYNFPKT